ncbi:phage tail tape measure protein [Anaerococcus vaginalis]|uniref:phage tail tape measure protein n=1 Tax=Anaerococcus vaginalis TaxID=33037 RepID=UPI00291153A3|nr:phage tail tape measure protein [Anaerococcus vaginalis]MDU5824016.1 phage tail tape measure protein [Anaerococcus vaginalis]
MARKVRGITIEFSADMTKFEKAMNEAYSKGRSLERQMKDINRLLKVRPDDKGLYTQAFATLSKQIEVSEKKLKELKAAYTVAVKEFNEGKIGEEALFALQRDIKATENDLKKFSKSFDELRKKSSTFEELRAKISKVDESLKKNKDLLSDVNKALKLDPKNIGLVKNQQDLLSDSIYETKKKIDLCRQAQSELVKEFNKGNYSKDEYTQKYAKLRTEIINAKEEMRKLAKESDITSIKLKNASEKFSSVGNSLKNAGDWMTRRVTLPITGAMTLATKEAISLENAMAGVRKTTDMTDTELRQMEDTFVSMSKTTPVTAKELANIGEMAGQLGIKKENIAEFSKVISDLTIATNLTAEEGAKDLARFMNITGLTQDKISNLGSAIVELGNNYATSENEIVQMGLRLAAQGKIAGLTEAQIMGIATALSSVGLKAERGGTSFSRIMMMNSAVLSTNERISVLNDMLEGTGYTVDDVVSAIQQGGSDGKAALDEIGEAVGMTADDLKVMVTDTKNASDKLKTLADVSGISAEEFANKWKSNPKEAIDLFIKGLSRMQSEGKDLGGVFKELGVSGRQDVDTLQRLAGSAGLAGKAMDDSTKAFESNVALQKEVEIFSKTTGNQLKILKNEFIALGLKIGKVLIPVLRNVVDWLKGLAEKAENMNPKTIEMFVKALLGLAAIGPIVGVVGRLLTSLGSVAGFAASVSGELAALSAGFGTSATTAGLFAKGLGALGPLLAPPQGLVIAGILAAVAGLVVLNKHMSESAIQTDIFGDEVSEGTKKAVGGFLELSDEAERSLTSLKATGETVSQETVDSIAGNFENMAGQISKKIDETKQPAIDSLTKMYTDMGTIQDEETINLINKVGSTYDGIKQKTEEGQARVKEILETAKNEKRALTEQEQYEIATIQYQMKDDGIRILSESEEEYYIIRQRMKDQAGELSAQQAAKIVEDSITTRDETIAKAEEEYNERLKYAAQLEADGSTESASLAEKIKEDALTTKEQTIADAKERHEKIVSEAKTQAGEHVNEVDWETGHIMTGWEMAWNSVSKSFETGWNSTKTFFGNMRRSILDFTADADRKIGEFKESVKRKGKEIIEGFINGMIKKWTDRATGLWDLIANTIDGIVEHIKNMFDFTLPMPRIPRPVIHWETHSVLGMDFSIPSGISWHKKGAIFTRPTLFATGSGLHGVGEAGAEAVLPIEKLDGIVANAMIKAGGSNNGVNITGNTFNVREEEDIEKIARKLYRLIESKKRGVGLG